MARPLRVEYPGAFYHVMNRGNAGEVLYKTKKDRERFLENIENAAKRFSLKVHTYCLMGNHYHLIVETLEPNLSRAMQWLHVSYAAYFNRKRNRVGHLFQGRFRAILVDAEEYLIPLSRYIHLNPVRARIVKNPADYVWSSYGAFIGKIRPFSWLDTELVISQFGKREKQAQEKYKNYVEGIDIKKLENPANDLSGGFILGSLDFVDWVKEAFLSSRKEENEIPKLKQLKPKVDVETVVKVVAAEFDHNEKEIRLKGRKGNLPRDMAIYLARGLTGEPGVELGKYFGNISGAGITVRCKNLESKMVKDKNLNSRVKRLKNRIINN